MALFDQSARNPLGLAPGRAEKVRVKNRAGATINQGQIVQFDVAASATETTAAVAFGGAGNPLSNVVLATSAHSGLVDSVKYLYGVVADTSILDNGEGWVYIRGVVQVLGGDTAAAGVGLTPTAASELVTAATDTNICAIALETMANATLKWVIFDGINGFGYKSTG